MMVLNTNLVFLATGSPSTSSGDLELVLLLLSIFLNFDFETIDTRILIIEKNTEKHRIRTVGTSFSCQLYTEHVSKIY
mgnify:CR=1 FL=1